MPNSMAIYDVLSVCSRLQNILKGAVSGEVHLLTYLACLLSIFKGEPFADWGYSFAGVDQGAPFSADVSDALDLLANTGLLVISEDLFKLTQTGTEELSLLESLTIYSDRQQFLKAACDSVLAIPIGTVRTAMSMEPGLKPVVTLGSSRALLSDSTLEQLYDHFQTLNQALEGQTEDLMVPATVWLTYLASVARERGIGIPSQVGDSSL